MVKFVDEIGKEFVMRADYRSVRFCLAVNLVEDCPIVRRDNNME